MSEPRTEAGRRLLRGVVNLRHRDNVDAAYECESGVDRCHDCVEDRDAVKAIEAEAATPDPRVERLEAAARAFVDVASEQYTVGDKTWPHRYDDARRALRALLRSPQERSGE
jgi:hypothetical protein